MTKKPRKPRKPTIEQEIKELVFKEFDKSIDQLRLARNLDLIPNPFE